MLPHHPRCNSQPSPEHHYNQQSEQRPPILNSYDNNVSPPSSPEPYDQDRSRRSSSGNVSPMEYDARTPHRTETPSPRVASHIPVPRKLTPRTMTRLKKAPDGEPTRWDDYTGEITRNESGKTATVKPGSPVYTAKPSNSRGLPSNPRQSLEQQVEDDRPRSINRNKATRSVDPGLYIDTRPPWRGASGRQTLVAPVADTPGQKIPVPRKELTKITQCRQSSC